MDIIWLASYPKSGNTWLANLIHNYVYGPVNFSAEVRQNIPDIHDLQSRGLGIDSGTTGGLICKTHYMFSPDHPYADATHGFIYLLRHPKDVLLSSLNYVHILKRNEHVDDCLYAKDFIHNMGLSTWREQGYGNWPEHLASWAAERERFPYLLLTYESMLGDPHGCLEKVCNYLNLSVDSEKIAQAVEASSFKRMRAMEEKERRVSKNSVFYPEGEEINEKAFFMNKGASNQSLAHLGEGLDELFDQRFAEILKSVGYM